MHGHALVTRLKGSDRIVAADTSGLSTLDSDLDFGADEIADQAHPFMFLSCGAVLSVDPPV